MIDKEHEIFRKQARLFADTVLAPIAEQVDKTGIYPPEVYEKVRELGFNGISIPKQYGGMGGDFFSVILATEQFCRTDVSAGSLLISNSLTGGPLLLCGNETQKQKYLRSLAEGTQIASFALTEPCAGCDTGAVSSTAVEEGDCYVLNGHKTYISMGPICDFAIVFAKTALPDNSSALTAFIVEADWPGFYKGETMQKLGINGSATCELFFENVRVPKENILGELGKGMRIVKNALNAGRITVAAQALGGAQGALDEAIKYSKERVQFGRRLASFQNTKFKIAEMAAKIEAGRQLIYNTVQELDKEIDITIEASMAKYYMAELANEVAYKSLQIHGGKGFMKGSAIERIYRDVRVLPIYEGTSEVQLMIIANGLMK